MMVLQQSTEPIFICIFDEFFRFLLRLFCLIQWNKKGFFRGFLQIPKRRKMEASSDSSKSPPAPTSGSSPKSSSPSPTKSPSPPSPSTSQSSSSPPRSAGSQKNDSNYHSPPSGKSNSSHGNNLHSPPPPRKNGGNKNHGSSHPKGSSHKDDVDGKFIIIGAAAGAGLLLFVVVIFFVVKCGRPKKKKQNPQFQPQGNLNVQYSQYHSFVCFPRILYFSMGETMREKNKQGRKLGIFPSAYHKACTAMKKG